MLLLLYKSKREGEEDADKKKVKSCEKLTTVQRANDTTFPLLRHSDPDSFNNFTRIQPEFSDGLLSRIRHRITKQNTKYRETIGPGLRLAVTLHNLATGNLYVDLPYSYRVVDKRSVCLHL